MGGGAITEGAPTASGTTVTYGAVGGYGNNVACKSGEEMTTDGTLYSGQKSCKAATHNAGNYYNWYAATAGTGTAELGSGGTVQAIELEDDGVTPKRDSAGQTIPKVDGNGNPVYSVISGVAQDSICPKHWHLATTSGSGSYRELIITTYNSDNGNSQAKDAAVQPNPLSFVRAGGYNYTNGNLYNRGSSGHYWESKVDNATYAYYLNFNSTFLLPQNYYGKGVGFSIRCTIY